MDKFDSYSVGVISRLEAEPFVIGIHYAKRWPSISFYFGLFNGPELVGVVCYGTPSSHTLRVGLAGKEFSGDVIELNRLCLKHNRKNEGSFLVSRSIKMLPKNKIIVSYADISHDHIGVVYQAANFIYCGLSAKRTDWAVKGMENLHGQTIADEFRGVKNRSVAMKEKYGDDFYLKPRSRKHRYIYIHGDKKYKKKALKSINYKFESYPRTKCA